MVEFEKSFLDSYKTNRPNSIHVISDATKVDYSTLFKKNNVREISQFLGSRRRFLEYFRSKSVGFCVLSFFSGSARKKALTRN